MYRNGDTNEIISSIKIKDLSHLTSLFLGHFVGLTSDPKRIGSEPGS